MNSIFELVPQQRLSGKFSRDVLREDFRTGLKDLDGGHFSDTADLFPLTC